MVGKQGRARPPELDRQNQASGLHPCSGGHERAASRILRLISNPKPILVITGAIAAIAVACSGPGAMGIIQAEPRFLDNDDCLGIDTRPLPIEQVELEYRDIRLRIGGEIASEAPQRTQGFMCRSEIAAGTGMYFELPAESIRGFWMFNTYVPLDILYLDPEGFTV